MEASTEGEVANQREGSEFVHTGNGKVQFGIVKEFLLARKQSERREEVGGKSGRELGN